MKGTTVRELHRMEDFEAVSLLYAGIWGSEPGSSPISAEVMRALSHAGNYVAGAYEGGRLVGASVAFLGDPIGTGLHSHITGAVMGRGVGLALKSHQRQWALARRLTRITWTYDPLIRRNAYFNLVKLGARPEEYLTSFYGAMDDAINGGDESDRVLAAWDLTAPTPCGTAPTPCGTAPTPCGTAPAPPGTTPFPPGPTPVPPETAPVPPETAPAPLEPAPSPLEVVELPAGAAHGVRNREGRPEVAETDAETVLVDLPDDIEVLRRTDPGAARAWRLAVRESLGGLLTEGARVVGLHERRRYVIQRTSTPA
ncbi:GNAT family N-acetyltransferase [Streptomyces albofaciens]|uniref:GNAT family N-acetyltransferase n=1 Tax=Streptomyces albofaciens TaxID=66866 RepID=UPI001FCC083D|nr:GNAT family N-acetyltransferase [Streptomyces albofaciens]